jgi:hypothetical protein
VPYRHAIEPASRDDAPRVPDRDEVVSYALLAGIGALPVTGALVSHEAFHTEATIGLVMLIAGGLGLAASARAAWRVRAARRR